MSNNWIRIIGDCFVGAEAFLPSGGDPFDYNQVVWITAPIDEATLAASVCALNPGGAFDPSRSIDDVIEFGESGYNIKNKFIRSSLSGVSSVESTFLALTNGKVVHVTISTAASSDNEFFVEIITGATLDGTGDRSGGTQIGVDLVKPVDVLDKTHTALAGYNFLSGDRIAVYLREGSIVEGTNVTGKAVKPLIRLFIQYD